jgi:hypothetical protein
LKIGLKPKKYAISASYKGFIVKNNVTVKIHCRYKESY